MPDHLFVYGTLKRGKAHHGLLRGSKLLGEHATEAVYTLFDLGGYPGVRLGGRQAVAGEVYRLPPGRLSRLDRFEGCPTAYRRVAITTPWGATWMYLYRGGRKGRVIRSF